MSHTILNRPTGPIGVGMLGLTKPGPAMPTTSEAIAVLKHSLEAGANLWDGAWYYGTPEYNSLHLLKAYFTTYPADASKVTICIKGCWTGQANVRPEQVKASIEECLEVLDGKCKIDIFQPGRLDPDIPVEETVGAVAEYVKAGKLGAVGLSECSATSLRKAHAVTPIAAVEIEMSLFELSPFNNGLAETCRELGVPIVAYSPLGKGFLTGQFKKFEDLPEDDVRPKFFPRFHKDNFHHNVKLAEQVEKIAKRKGFSIAQVAISWVAAQTKTIGTPVIPIPGVTSTKRVDENMTLVGLSAEELKELDQLAKNADIKGERTPAFIRKYLEV